MEQSEAAKEAYKDQLMIALLENMRIAAQNQRRYDILEIKYKRSEAELEISDKDIIFISMKLEKLRDRTKGLELALEQERAKTKQYHEDKAALTTKGETLQKEVTTLQEEKSKLTEELATACSSMEGLQKESEQLEAARQQAEQKLKESKAEVGKIEELLTLANERYEYAQKAYKLAVEKSMSSPREPSPAAPLTSNLQTDLTRTRQLLANSRDKNVDLVSQLKGSEKELADARWEMQFLKEENAQLQSEQMAVRPPPPISIITGSSAGPSKTQEPAAVTSERPQSPIRMDPGGQDFEEISRPRLGILQRIISGADGHGKGPLHI